MNMDITTNSILYGDFFRNGQYGRHETFHVRTGWLRKAYRSVEEIGPSIFSEENASEYLGVGKNMVNAIRYWAVAFGIIEKDLSSKDTTHKRTRYKRTKFSDFLFEKDEYLEDPASGWLLHYNLVTNPKNAPIIFWAFNLMSFNEFNKYSFFSGIKAFLSNIENMRDIPEKTLTSEYSTFIRTYCERSNESTSIKEDVLDSLLSALQIISIEFDKSTFRFKIGKKKDLPSQLVTYSIFKMLEKDRINQGVETTNIKTFEIGFDKLLWGVYGPGMCFKLDGETLLDYIEDICNNNYLGKATYSTTAGIRQLIVQNKQALNDRRILGKYFKDEIK